MISLGLTSYDMELWFSDLSTSYEMELETHGHVHIENQIGFVGYDVSIVGYGMVYYNGMIC